MKSEICEKEGHQFRILKYWQTDISSTGTGDYLFSGNDWYILMTCLKCGRVIIRRAEKENAK